MPLIYVRETAAADLEFVLGLESAPDNRSFVGVWSREEHLAFLSGAGNAHRLLFDGRDDRPVGYFLLSGLDSPHRSIELKRIVIRPKGLGLGRAALKLVKRIAFESLGAHRLWLDVFLFNHRARHLYASEGFIPEAVLRECVLRDGRYESLQVMSLLEREYRSSVDRTETDR